MPSTISSERDPLTNESFTQNETSLVNERRKDRPVSRIQMPPSPADSDIVIPDTSPSSSLSAITREEHRITRPIDRGAPGDQAIFSESKTPEQKALAKRKSQYYGDVFAAREPLSSARERISRESMIMADIRTNVIVQDEYTFITDLSYALSTRYQRPESSILVTVAHSACLLFGGSFDPAYTMTITALASQLQPVTNKRNASLLAKAMEEGLGVGPDRGLIKFVAIAEENLATNGRTLAGDIEELEKENGEDNSNLKRNLSRANKNKKRQSMKSLRNLKSSSHLPTHDEQLTPPLSEPMSPPLPGLPPKSAGSPSPHTPKLPEIPTEKSAIDRRAEKTQKMGRRRSFIATIFGKA
ncbi:Tautomerase/MIF superfamily [Halenospora varia]|nr:Tautomerase/MIF superfamily [Halenospora varia]